MTDEALFSAVLGQPLPERQTFLDDVCAGDPEQRKRLLALLAGHEQASGILDLSAAPLDWARLGTLDGVSQEAHSGVVLAERYKLLEEIGEGGMGTVWKAEQVQPVRRIVAVKFVKAGMDSKAVLARFDAERQALAVMDHPNISKVLDGGTTQAGRPFFVMEYVKGVPITNYCDTNRLSVAERLGLFVSVCQAVQHAHQKGIIHRDLKPSNILVCLYDGRPVPKVIDFGLAKAINDPLTDHTLHTSHGQMVGTPLYMSPEQAEFNNLDLDTRTDVYALGVILYELLTGSTPIERDQLQRAAWDEMLRLIREQDPPRPSNRLSGSATLPSVAAQRQLEPLRLTKLIRGELDWIVMKCLEKSRSRRYDTANGLARDVERYLADEPVEACPPSTIYRLHKVARKYRKALITLAVFAVLLTTATAVSIGLAAWAIRERDQADLQKQEAEAQKRTAEVNFNRAMSAVDRMLTHVSENKLVHVPQMEPVRRELLKDALHFYRQFLAERREDPTVRSEAADAYKRVATILLQLGPADQCEEACRQALGILEKMSDESPEDQVLIIHRSDIHGIFGNLYVETGDYPNAEAQFRKAEALLDATEKKHPEDRFARLNLAKIRSSLVRLYRNAGRLDDGVLMFQKARVILEELISLDPGNADYREVMGYSYQSVALIYSAQDKNLLAEEANLKGLDYYQQLVREQPDSVKMQKQVARISNNLAVLYSRESKLAKAEPLIRQSLAVNEALARDYPKHIEFTFELAGSYGNMATHVRKSGSAEKSLEWSDKAIRTAEALLSQNPKDAPTRLTAFNSLYERALAYDELGRTAEAMKDRKRMLDLSETESHITMRLFRPSPLAKLGEHAKASAEIEKLISEGHTQGRNYYNFGYVLAMCSSRALKDDRLAEGERRRLADNYGRRCVELLRNALQVGYFNAPDRLERLKSNDYDSVRGRDDFIKLLAELGNPPKAAK